MLNIKDKKDYLEHIISDKNSDYLIAKSSLKGKYYVCAGSDNILYDPYNISHDITKKDRFRGGKFFALVKCNQHCYLSYTKYLEKKNKTDLVLAQRSFLDGGS